MIPCTGDCVYQADGQCGLEHAASKGSSAKGDCRYRVERGAGAAKRKRRGGVSG
jgi:hypothetical protein